MINLWIRIILQITLIVNHNSCNSKEHKGSLISNEEEIDSSENTLINKQGINIEQRFLCPPNFDRTKLKSTSYGSYLRSLRLKPYGSNVIFYDGSIKYNHDVYESVVDLAIGDKDLHQCADAIIRLKADYHWNNQEPDKIHFNLTNGDRIEYSKWKEEYRLKIVNNKSNWIKTDEPSESFDTYWDYLELIFNYAGTYSLTKELIPVNISDAHIGDVLIKGGFPGHAVLIVDEVIDIVNDRKLYLLGQSYMPAQEFQILKNNKETYGC